jgi:hypothetical protein
MSFSCRHYSAERCVLLKKQCDPGCKGCVLYGKFVFASPDSPSNAAIKRRELTSNAKDKKIK